MQKDVFEHYFQQMLFIVDTKIKACIYGDRLVFNKDFREKRNLFSRNLCQGKVDSAFVVFWHSFILIMVVELYRRFEAENMEFIHFHFFFIRVHVVNAFF